MDNHVHLLTNQGEDSISRIMKRIGTSYAHYFNKKYNRIGHLFQDRFKSETVENDSYLLAVTRYIHNNPVKVGIVDCAFQFQWSSYLIHFFDYTRKKLN
jgi:putative transposase